jgi:hypothetical protein
MVERISYQVCGGGDSSSTPAKASAIYRRTASRAFSCQQDCCKTARRLRALRQKLARMPRYQDARMPGCIPGITIPPLARRGSATDMPLGLEDEHHDDGGVSNTCSRKIIRYGMLCIRYVQEQQVYLRVSGS